MPFVNRNSGAEERSEDVAAGAPPFEHDDFDPNDPNVVKVHYDVSGWSHDQVAELAETLAERSVPHVWEDQELVVPEAIEADVDELFDELEAEIGPFPVLLDDETPSTEFGLDEWPARDLDLLRQALVDAEIPHRWVGSTVVVDERAENVVDDLLDAIEEGEVASLDDEVEAPEGALNDLYVAADRLRRDPADAAARRSLLDLVPLLDPRGAPYGLAVRSWEVIVDRARAVAAAFESGADADEVAGAADELLAVCRPWV